jgi:hypothetical protein
LNNISSKSFARGNRRRRFIAASSASHPLIGRRPWDGDGAYNSTRTYVVFVRRVLHPSIQVCLKFATRGATLPCKSHGGPNWHRIGPDWPRSRVDAFFRAAWELLSQHDNNCIASIYCTVCACPFQAQRTPFLLQFEPSVPLNSKGTGLMENMFSGKAAKWWKRHKVIWSAHVFFHWIN